MGGKVATRIKHTSGMIGDWTSNTRHYSYITSPQADAGADYRNGPNRRHDRSGTKTGHKAKVINIQGQDPARLFRGSRQRSLLRTFDNHRRQNHLYHPATAGLDVCSSPL